MGGRAGVREGGGGGGGSHTLHALHLIHQRHATSALRAQRARHDGSDPFSIQKGVRSLFVDPQGNPTYNVQSWGLKDVAKPSDFYDW